MRPAARIQAAIEILSAVEAGIANLGMPADAVFSTYCRKRRYIGSKDRRAISALVYGVIRSRALQIWRINAAGLDVTARSMVISYLHVEEPESLAYFDEVGDYAAASLSPHEVSAVDAFSKLSVDDIPQYVRLELPEWMEVTFHSRFDTDYDAAVIALNATASFDLRLNPLKASDNIINDIKNEIEDVVNNQYSPIGYRSNVKRNIQDSALYRDGKVEVQDEAAQLACYLVDAHAGMNVVDMCAGAGGKSLLVSALMKDTGRINALDISGKRLKELDKRAKRSGCSNIKTINVPANGSARYNALEPFKDGTDRVIIDAPCSGTGTWRRNPDQRWRLSPKQIEEYAAVQLGLLAEGATMVKSGGRLIYMTCSVLEAENEDVVAGFMKQHSDQWTMIAYKDIWAKTLSAQPPETLSTNPSFLQLAPHQHQTDGFFVAILEKL